MKTISTYTQTFQIRHGKKDADHPFSQMSGSIYTNDYLSDYFNILKIGCYGGTWMLLQSKSDMLHELLNTWKKQRFKGEKVWWRIFFYECILVIQPNILYRHLYSSSTPSYQKDLSCFEKSFQVADFLQIFSNWFGTSHSHLKTKLKLTLTRLSYS